MTAKNTPGRFQRAARLRWVPIGQMRVSPVAQRDLNWSWVHYLAANMDVEQLGTPTVNERGDGFFYIIDGQHRVEALKEIGWADQEIQCWTYEGLSEQEEAERFLKLNHVLAVGAFYRFRSGVEAGRAAECDIDRIVRAQGLTIAKKRVDGAISAVGTLMKIYHRAGGPVLGRTLRIIRDAYGTPGLESAVIDGIGLLCGRYNGDLQDELAVVKLSRVHGGVNGLLGKARMLHKNVGSTMSHCIAASAVEVINQGTKASAKLTPWWREEKAA